PDLNVGGPLCATEGDAADAVEGDEMGCPLGVSHSTNPWWVHPHALSIRTKRTAVNQRQCPWPRRPSGGGLLPDGHAVPARPEVPGGGQAVPAPPYSSC